MIADEQFDLPVRGQPERDTLILQLGSWEGPLDLLLTLARAQKVDLAQISILALVDQYLAFIREARALADKVFSEDPALEGMYANLRPLIKIGGDMHATET